MSERTFSVRVRSAGGQAEIQSLRAQSRDEALRLAFARGVHVLELKEESAAKPANAKIKPDEAILLLRQLAVMLGAGVQLLDAIETLAEALSPSAAAAALNKLSEALRRGERLGDALENNLPIYPAYVYGLVRAGEATSALAKVLEEAANQLAFERRVERDIINALSYPGFLMLSGAASVAFLLYFVAPRFASMLAATRAAPPPMARFVLDAGTAFHAHAPFIVLCALALGASAMMFARTALAKTWLARLLEATPGINSLIAARRRTIWSRIGALSLGAGIPILDAISLAAGALKDGQLKTKLLAVIPALRAGRPIDAAFRETGAVSQIDASLLRAGQRSGALAKMLHVIADRHEEDLRDIIKRLTLILEPASIAFVALMVGAIVLSMASALVGVYETIG
ncbi:type II secretion system F family protein [Candidatus Viadribacter manganicus]|uniref:Type II secretion system protein GspF domain-containing protein n=1 Tax=Candidatus Viadribacter manganicus TaxID=1759059 RepID=A0A1B1AGP1_9PROT|nr:type II secretion system F family protein [Candidatus Viadribacter manganicus]ANP45720.1 hypothetical protein ATE48_07210 [Candidatus Viadribacter manganicus]